MVRAYPEISSAHGGADQVCDPEALRVHKTHKHGDTIAPRSLFHCAFIPFFDLHFED